VRQHFPPWPHHSHRAHHHPPPWQSDVIHKRRFLFRRFLALFGVLVLFFVSGILGVLLLLRPAHENPSLALLACFIPLLFTLAAFILGGLAFRRIGSPLVEVMAAADAVAEGDFSVRVHENGPGEFRRLASSFNRMTAELERSAQQRRNMTADVAHELRTPLHIIQGNLEGILDGVYQPEREHIAATLEETRLLARLVNDLQTLSLAEAGQLPLHPILVSTVDLLQDVQTSFAGQAAAAGVELRLVCAAQDGDLPVRADPDRLDQVLSNLVSNALRHTPAGGCITLRAQPRAPDGVRLTVQDTGSGIAAQDLPYVFDRFWKSDRSRTRQAGTGSGLGLAIARQLVQAHGGQIRVESLPGEGATFIVELPGSTKVA